MRFAGYKDPSDVISIADTEQEGSCSSAGDGNPRQ